MSKQSLVFEGKTLKVEIEIWKETVEWVASKTVYIRGKTDITWNGRSGGDTPHAAFAAIQEGILNFINFLPQPQRPIKADIREFEEWAPAIEIDESVLDNATSKFEADNELADDKEKREEIARQETKLAEKREERAKKDELLKETYQALGRIEGVKLITDLGNVFLISLLKQVKETEAYKEFGTWENYCKSIGYTKRHVDEQLLNLQTLSENFMETVSHFSLGFRDYKVLRSAVKDGALKITDKSVIIDVVAEDTGEVEKREVAYEDKEHLESLLETIIEERNTEIKAAKRELAAEKLTKARHEKQIVELNTSLSKTEALLKNYTEGADIGGMPAADRPDFEKLYAICLKITNLYGSINLFVERVEQLAPANQEYLGGTITFLLHMAEILRRDIGVKTIAMDRFYNLPEGVEAIENVLIPGARNAPGHKSAALVTNDDEEA
jgi:hypothetical protein